MKTLTPKLNNLNLGTNVKQNQSIADITNIADINENTDLL